MKMKRCHAYLRDGRRPLEAPARGVHVLGDGDDGVGQPHLDGAPLVVGLGPARVPAERHLEPVVVVKLPRAVLLSPVAAGKSKIIISDHFMDRFVIFFPKNY